MIGLYWVVVLRVAIFHDYFSFIGGCEKLILTLARRIGADVITTNVDRALISRTGFDDVRIISLGRLTALEPLKQIQATLKFSACDFRDRYDFFIFSGNSAHHASGKHRPNLYYCHDQAFYNLKETSIRSPESPLARAADRTWTAAHGYFDRRSIDRVECIVANSWSIARRMKKYFGRESVVVYPPADTARFRNDGDGGYWLSVNRIFPEKRIEIQLEAFERMPGENLVIVGGRDSGEYSGAYGRHIRGRMPPNVIILSDVPEDVLIGLYSRCRGLISTSVDEPFGMNAVEAMASGKPVIAPKEGGSLESVVDGLTGILIDCTPEALVRAVKRLSLEPGKYREACVRQAKKFDIEVFVSRMLSLLERDGRPSLRKV